MTTEFFIVLSVKSDYYTRVTDFIEPLKTSSELDKLLVLEENGADGSHPHLNIVLNFKAPIYQRNLKRKFRQIVGSKSFDSLQAEQPRLYRSKTVANLVDLVGGYLQKEKGFKVIFSSGYDVDRLKRDFDKSPKAFSCQRVRMKALSKLEVVRRCQKLSEEQKKNLNDIKDYIDILSQVNQESSLVHLRPQELSAIRVHCIPDSDAFKKYIFEKSCTTEEKKRNQRLKNLLEANQNQLKVCTDEAIKAEINKTIVLIKSQIF